MSDFANPSVIRFAQLAQTLEFKNLSVSPLVWHYTSFHSLKSILDSKKVYGTETSFLNDQTEYWHFNDYIHDLLDEVSASDDEFSSICSLIKEKIPPKGTNQFTGVYVFCMSEEGDLLSQWRAYANNGNGVSIGFDADFLQAVKMPIVFDRCIYLKNQESKFREIFYTVLPEVLSNSQAGHQEGFCKGIANYFRFICAAVKNPGFSEEREWRLIRYSSTEDQLSADMFRSRDGSISMSREMELDHLPIRKVIIGPSRKAAHSKAALELYFNEVWRQPVTVEISQIPYVPED